MTQFTSELPDSVDPVKPGEISPRYTIVRAVGYLAAWVGVVSVCAVPYGYLPVSHGSWNTGSAQFDFGPVLLAIYLTAALAACGGSTSSSTSASHPASAAHPFASPSTDEPLRRVLTVLAGRLLSRPFLKSTA